ncbi:receptor-type tyrosine- phosphatase mu-like protein [Labeo rohita]|uniref:Receptor-type tyrosine-phosphatase mu-like protein n=1 Tax=Labeo rohita TaxID=84645 RepID=A0A498MK00_LABRO|nr:receptor-type tyrosine- phosphatase mu-like protein [Labeo rohita]
MADITEDCLLEKSYTDCGYSQGKDDDFDWEQINTKQKPSSDPWVPSAYDQGRRQRGSFDKRCRVIGRTDSRCGTLTDFNGKRGQGRRDILVFFIWPVSDPTPRFTRLRRE